MHIQDGDDATPIIARYELHAQAAGSLTVRACTGSSTMNLANAIKYVVSVRNDMSDTTVATIEELRNDSVELAHSRREFFLHSLHYHPVAVGHLAPNMTNPVEAYADLNEEIQPRSTIVFHPTDIFSTVAT